MVDEENKSMWKHRQKLNNRKGFSLTELLVAILILSMVSSVVAGGIPVAKEAYEKVTLSANAQVMLSTTISSLRNELCTATDVTILDNANNIIKNGTNGVVIRYYSPSIKNYSTLSIGKPKTTDNKEDANEKQNSIILTQYADSSVNVPRRLVSSAAGDHQLYVSYKNVSYDETNKIVTFTELKVVDKSGKECAKLKDEDNEIKIKLIG